MAERLQYVIEVSGGGDVALRKFRGELEQTERAGSRFASGIKSAALGLISFNQGLDLISKGLNFAARTFHASLGSVIKRGSELQDMSRRLGASVEMLSQFEYAAQQAGVGIGDLAGGFRGLNKALVDASKQGSDANKILQQQLGFTQQQIAAFKGDPLKAVLAIADGFNQFEDGAEKAVAAQALFGRSGQAFLQLFKDGSSEIRKNIALVKQYGANVDDNMTAAADRAGDAYDRLQLALTGVKTRLLGQPDLLNAIGSALERVSDKVAEVGQAFAERFGPEIAARIESIGSAVESLMNSFDGADAIRRASEALGSAASAVSGLGNAISNLFALAQGVNNLSPLSKALVAYALFGIPGAVAYGGLSLAYGAASDAASGSAQARADVAAAEARAKAAQNPDDVRAGLFGPTGSHYYKRRYLENARAGLTPLDQSIAKPYGPEQGPGTEAGIAELMQYRGATTAGKLRTGLGGGLGGGGGGGGGGKRGGSGDAESAVKRFYDYLAQRQQDALQAGLKGEDLLIAKRDEEYLKATKLADEAKASEEQRAQAYRLIWEDYEKQIAVVRQDAAEKQTKAAEEALREQQKPFTNFIENIQRGFGDLFSSIIQDGKLSGDTLVSIFKQAAARLIGELVSLQLTNAFQGLLGNATGGTSGTLTTLLSALNSGGGAAPTSSGGGSLSTLLGYGKSLLGVGGSALGSGLSSVSSLLSGGSGTAALLSLGLAAANSGGGGFKLTPLSGGMLGLSAIRAIAPYLASTSYGSSLVSSLQGTSYGEGLLGVLGVTQPAYGVAGGAIGPPTAAQAGGSLASSVSSLVSIIGSLYSLYSSIDATIKTNAGFKRATLGDRQANQNFQGTSYAALGGGIVGGALVGAAAGAGAAPATYGASILIGAAIGATVASVVQQQIAKTIARGTAEGIGQGLTQNQFDRKISNSLANGIVGYLLPHMQITQNLSGGGDQALFASFFSPDIEDIYDKIGSKIVAKASGGQFAPNRRLSVFGQGTTAAQRERIAPIGENRLQGLARILLGMSGGGTGVQNERVKRQFAILFNTLASGGFSTEEAAQRTDLAVRGIYGGQYFNAARRGRAFGEIDKGYVTSAQDLAFGRVFGGVDWRSLRAAFEAMIEAGKVLRKDRKASRDAVEGSLGGLLSGSTSVGDFQSSLAGAVGKWVEDGVSKIFLRGIGGDLLTGLRSGIRRGLKKYRKTGDAAGFSEGLEPLLDATAKAFGSLNVSQLQMVFNQGLEFAVKLQVAAGDLAGATATLNEKLAPVVNTLKGYRQLSSDVKSRTAFALAGSGFAGRAAQLDALHGTTEETRSALIAAFPSMRFFVGNQTDVGRALGTQALGTIDATKALPLVQAFTEARLSELEAELSYARDLSAAWKDVRGASQDFLDTLALATKGPSARRGIFDRKRSEFDALVAGAGNDPSKLLDVLGKGNDLLSLGSQIFAPGSLEFQQLTAMLERVTSGINSSAIAEQIKADDRVKAAEANVTAFRDTMTPVLIYIQAAATRDVVSAINTLTEQFKGQTGVLGLLATIASGLGVTVPTTNARVAGTSGITINIPITAGAGSADEIVAHVEKAIRQNKGQIVNEIKRVKAA